MNNGPSAGHSGQMKILLFRPPLMVFWWVPYLAKRPRPDFNNGSGDNSNCGCILGIYLSSTWIMTPPQAIPVLGHWDESTPVHLNLWSPKILIIHLMSAISGPRLDFNNCPWDNSNNTPILTDRRLFVSDSNNGPSPGLCNLGQMKDTPVQVSHFWSPGGCNVWPSAPGLTSIMAQGITWIVASFWPPAFVPV